MFLYTKNLAVGYNRKILIDNIEISVKRGQIVTLIGANGTGKSTILKSIIKQLDIISGDIFLDSKNINSFKNNELSKSMSVLMTDRISTDFTTCSDIVKTGRYPYTGQFGILSETDKEKVRDAMELCSVTEIADKNFENISDGQRQRVMLARAICQEPDIMVLDEPTSFLDIHHKIQMLNILKKLVREKNIGVIMSMHELDLAQRISDYVIGISDGKIDRMGTPDEIFTSGYIGKLYGVVSYEHNYGAAELERPAGIPESFVIAGGGTGIQTFRKLQRENVPFIAGIIHESDIDYPAAKALAAEVITEKPFEPINNSTVKYALEKMSACRNVICSVNAFGTINQGNLLLKEYAEKQGILINIR